MHAYKSLYVGTRKTKKYMMNILDVSKVEILSSATHSLIEERYAAFNTSYVWLQLANAIICNCHRRVMYTTVSHFSKYLINTYLVIIRPRRVIDRSRYQEISYFPINQHDNAILEREIWHVHFCIYHDVGM